MRTPSALTAPKAVLKAIAECDRMGRDAFLARHGFGRAHSYFLRHKGPDYDSKAIVGVAYGYEHGRALRAHEFSGGAASVWRVLTRLGFDVREPERRAGLTLRRPQTLDCWSNEYSGFGVRRRAPAPGTRIRLASRPRPGAPTSATLASWSLCWFARPVFARPAAARRPSRGPMGARSSKYTT